MTTQSTMITEAHRVKLQLAATFGVAAATKAVDLVHRSVGTSGIRRTKPFERYHRDAHTLTQHAFSSASRYESAGKIMVGLESDWPYLAY